jgi:hypothetical protein
MIIKVLQDAIEAKRFQMRELADELDDLVANLRRSGCDHAKAEAYDWEHDNGYDTQRKVNGKQCIFCGYIDLWNRGHFVSGQNFV